LLLSGCLLEIARGGLRRGHRLPRCVGRLKVAHHENAQRCHDERTEAGDDLGHRRRQSEVDAQRAVGNAASYCRDRDCEGVHGVSSSVLLERSLFEATSMPGEETGSRSAKTRGMTMCGGQAAIRGRRGAPPSSCGANFTWHRGRVKGSVAVPPIAPDPNSRLRLLYDLGCAFAGRIEIDELIPLVMSKVREVLDAEGASVLLLDEAKQELYFPYVVSERQDVATRLAGLRLPAHQGIAGAALQTGRPIRVDDVHADPRFYPGIDRATGSSTRSVVAAPLIARRGTIGVLQVVNRHGGALDDADLGFLEALAGSVAVAIENAQLYARLKESEE